MVEQRLETLRTALEPMREARAILGDVLMGMGSEDDGAAEARVDPSFWSVKERTSRTFSHVDDAIEQIGILTGLPLRDWPEESAWVRASEEVHDRKISLRPPIPPENVEFVRAYEEALTAWKGRPLKDHVATRPPGFKGLPADQRMSALKDTMKLMRKAMVSINAAYDVEWEIVKRLCANTIDLTGFSPRNASIRAVLEDVVDQEIYDAFNLIDYAWAELEDAIDGVKRLLNLPRSPMRVLFSEWRASPGGAATEHIVAEMDRIQETDDRAWGDGSKSKFN